MREQGCDWCIIELGLPGVLHGLNIDTNHFLGNHPPYASVDAARTDDISEATEWTEILPKSPLNPGAQNLFGVYSDEKWKHLRLTIYPDGGVARFRVFCEVTSDLKTGDKVDLVALENGGKAIACSDIFFSSMTNLIMPGRARSMDEVNSSSDSIWWDYCLEDFSQHPRIGDLDSLRAKFTDTEKWAGGEQKGVQQASEEVLMGLAAGNDQYEQKFGYIFIFYAT